MWSFYSFLRSLKIEKNFGGVGVGGWGVEGWILLTVSSNQAICIYAAASAGHVSPDEGIELLRARFSPVWWLWLPLSVCMLWIRPTRRLTAATRFHAFCGVVLENIEARSYGFYDNSYKKKYKKKHNLLREWRDVNVLDILLVHVLSSGDVAVGSDKEGRISRESAHRKSAKISHVGTAN